MFSIFRIFFLLLIRCLRDFISPFCLSGFSLNIILNPFFFLCITCTLYFSWFFGWNLLFGLQAAKFPKCSDSFRFQAALAFIRSMTSLGWPLCRFAIFARQKWGRVSIWSIDHCTLRWLCSWQRYWMLQDIDNMETSCIFYVKVGVFTHLEQSKISLLMFNKKGIVRLTLQHDMIISVSFT